MAILQTDASGIALTNNSGKSLLKTTGSILQVVNATSSSTNTTTSTSFQASSLAVSITPNSTSSKILIISHFSANQETQASSGDGGYFSIFRSGTNLGDASYGMIFVSTNSPPIYTGASLTWLDSPSTTSSVEYKLYFRSKSTGTVSAVTGSGGESRAASITAMEIVA